MVSQMEIMTGIKGHLQVKNDRYQMVVNYKDSDGKWKQKSKSTGLRSKGNKKRSEEMLSDYESALKAVAKNPSLNNDAFILFSDYIEIWLQEHKKRIRPSTYSSYYLVVHNGIIPFFKERKTTLLDLKPSDISAYYEYLLETGNTANTVKHHHANIRKALDAAFKKEIIESNPADKVELPKIKKYSAEFYGQSELQVLFSVLDSKEHWLEDIVLLTAFYGLRRSEVIGLLWDSIDLKEGIITIEHTVTPGRNDDGSMYWAKEYNTKNDASLRQLPLVPEIKDMLKKRKEQQELYQEVCGKSYNREHLGYVFVDELGYLVTPDRASRNFKSFLESNKLKHIRFHDLRHSCASLLLDKGVSLKEIQLWLGHSNFNTTADIYGHLAESNKLSQASVMQSALLGS